MVKFRELEILKCGGALRLDVTLENLDIFPTAYISEIIIDTGKTYIPTGPSATPVYTKLYTTDITTVVEEISAEAIGVNLNEEILFVYVVVDGLPVDYNESNYGPKTALKSAVNEYVFYSKIINSIKGLSKKCTNNSDFIDNMLLYKAYEYSSLMCNYNLAITLWYRFTSSNKITSSKACGCHG